jgi:hypothetical protein
VPQELPEYLRECWHGQLARGNRGEAGSDGQLVQFGVSFLLSLFLATRLTAAKAVGR